MDFGFFPAVFGEEWMFFDWVKSCRTCISGISCSCCKIYNAFLLITLQFISFLKSTIAFRLLTGSWTFSAKWHTICGISSRFVFCKRTIRVSHYISNMLSVRNNVILMQLSMNAVSFNVNVNKMNRLSIRNWNHWLEMDCKKYFVTFDTETLNFPDQIY